MLKARDDQGWCTGRKDGKVGLYPDTYVELMRDDWAAMLKSSSHYN